MKLPSILIVICYLLIGLPLSAQDRTRAEEFWVSPGADMALYSPVSLSYGGGIAIAYGSGTSIGIKASWLFDNDALLNILVLDILFRLYFFEASANSGLFIQLAGGPALYFEHKETASFPYRIGIPTVGLALGWRFLLGKYFFIEPSIRGGYPYIVGAGLSTGVHF